MGRPARERHIPIREFFRGPGETCLEPGEVVVRVRIPLASSTLGTGSSFIKLARRRSLAIAVINGAAWIALAGSAAPCIAEARIALGAVAPTPIRLPAVEDWLRGRPVTKAVFAEAGRRALACINPINDIRATADYRRDVAAVLVERLLTQAALDANFCFEDEAPVSPGCVSPAQAHVHRRPRRRGPGYDRAGQGNQATKSGITRVAAACRCGVLGTSWPSAKRTHCFRVREGVILSRTPARENGCIVWQGAGRSHLRVFELLGKHYD